MFSKKKFEKKIRRKGLSKKFVEKIALYCIVFKKKIDEKFRQKFTSNKIHQKYWIVLFSKKKFVEKLHCIVFFSKKNCWKKICGRKKKNTTQYNAITKFVENLQAELKANSIVFEKKIQKKKYNAIEHNKKIRRKLQPELKANSIVFKKKKKGQRNTTQ